MEQTKREIYNEMMHNYLTEELIKEVQERTKLLDEDYAESIKMQELHLQEKDKILIQVQRLSIQERTQAHILILSQYQRMVELVHSGHQL